MKILHWPGRVALVIAATAFACLSSPSAAESNEDSKALLLSDVVDDTTGEPIAEFSALAGTSCLPGLGWQWQPHTIYVFRDGELRWPPPKRRGYDKQVLRIEAAGYVPLQTPEIVSVAGAQPLQLKIRLVRDKGIDAQVLTPQGAPAADANIAVAMANRTIALRAGRIVPRPGLPGGGAYDRWVNREPIKSSADGRFHMPSEAGPAKLVITHDTGVAILEFAKFAELRRVQLQEWGTIEGQVLWGDTVGQNETITLIAHGISTNHGDGFSFPMVSHFDETISDAEGHFLFRQVPPGRAQLSRDNALPYQHHDVAAGGTTQVVFGGSGRPVIGQLAGRSSWEDVRIRIAPNAPRPGDMGTEHDPWPAYGKFLSSPAGKKYAHEEVPISDDGSFRIDRVLPENYQLFVTAPDANGKPANIGYASFHVVPVNEGEPAEPHDLGTIKTF